ncbi:biotin carboxylase N-terminal domain-containing protein [Escherichia coli]
MACSESDINSLPAKSADEVIVIGKSRADDSYLDGKKIIDAALQSGAQAIHPGYGFLSENASFARAVLDAGLIFLLGHLLRLLSKWGIKQSREIAR